MAEYPSGGTPGSAIGIAVDQLEARGLKDRNNMTAHAEDKEYWLVILTDGAFDEQTASVKADNIIEQHIIDFPSLKSIYLGLGGAAPNLSSSQLTQKVPFTPFRAATTDDMVSAMQSVANLLSGRYTLDASHYTANGSTVTIDLSKSDLSFKNISVIAQNCGVKLVSAKHNGTALQISNPCVIVPSGLSGIQNGFSAVLSGSDLLHGGTLELTFSGPITADKISILAEPALIIQSYLEYKDGNEWKRTTMQYINSHMSENDQIRVGYEVFDQANGEPIDLNQIFGDCTASVTYAGNSYGVNMPIPLVVGNNEINVAVSVMNGAYTMYSSTICIIEQNPSYYRVEQVADKTVSIATRQAKAVYTVFADNRALSASELAAYSWAVTVKAPDGSDAAHTASVGSDGKISVNLVAEAYAYGNYTVEFTVTSEYGLSRTAMAVIPYYPESIEITGSPDCNLLNRETSVTGQYTIALDGVQMTAEALEKIAWEVKAVAPDGSDAEIVTTVATDGTITSELAVPTFGFGEYKITVAATIAGTMKKEYVQTVRKYPTGISLATKTPGSMSMSQYDFNSNEGAFAFELLLDGVPCDVTNSLLTYRVTVNGTDMTQYVTCEGNVLRYLPKVDQFGGSMAVGEYAIEATVSVVGQPLSATATAALSITPTIYEILSLEQANKTADRFRLDDAPAYLYFKVLRDGKTLSEEELRAALESGELKVKDNKGTFNWKAWLPCGDEVSVEVLDGVPVVAFRVDRDWIKPFHSFAAMLILNGENPITVSYGGVETTDCITFAKSPVWSYIWRVLVILFVIHCILYIIGFFNGKCKSLRSGSFVVISIYGDSDDCTVSVKKGVNLTFWEKYGWHLFRFIPHRKKLWYHQDPVEYAKLTLGYDDDGNFGIFCKKNGIYRVIFDNNGSQMAVRLSDLRRAVAKYTGKNAKPRMKGEPPIGAEARSVLHIQPGDGYIPQNTLTNYPFYGRLDSDDALGTVVFFVERQ